MRPKLNAWKILNSDNNSHGNNHVSSCSHDNGDSSGSYCRPAPLTNFCNRRSALSFSTASSLAF